VTRDDTQRLRLLVAEGLTLRAISERLGMSKPATCRLLARCGLPVPESGKGHKSRTHVRDVLKFFELWNSPELTIGEIAQRLDVAPGAVMRAARHYGLGKRMRVVPDRGEAVEPDEDLASCESLRLAPTVAAAAAEVRQGWSDDERYQRRVTKVQPVTYGSVYW
jgi:AraC-like DNA-binding protein